MKKLACYFALAFVAGVSSACLYSPDVTYTYWRYSPATQLYSPIRTEVPLSAEEMREQGLLEKLPEDAKTVESR